MNYFASLCQKLRYTHTTAELEEKTEIQNAEKKIEQYNCFTQRVKQRTLNPVHWNLYGGKGYQRGWIYDFLFIYVSVQQGINR